MEPTSTNPAESTQALDLQVAQKDFLQFLQTEGKSPNTVKNYRTDLDLFLSFIKDHQNNHLLVDFNFAKVSDYGQFLQRKYTSDNSKRRRIQTLRLFFDYLVNKGHATDNPVRKLPTSPKFLDIPRPTPFADAQKLWEHLCNEGLSNNPFEALLAKRNQIIFLLIFGSGLKVSDLSKLQMSHIHEDAPMRVLLHPPKRDPYTVPVIGLYNTVFKDYKSQLEIFKGKSELEFGELLFNANPYRILAGGISARGLEIIFEDLRKKLTIHLTPKSLRQAGIFNWLNKGIGETLIKEWMGVAPSYSLKLYRTHLEKHPYSEGFVDEIYYRVLHAKMQ